MQPHSDNDSWLTDRNQISAQYFYIVSIIQSKEAHQPICTTASTNLSAELHTSTLLCPARIIISY